MKRLLKLSLPILLILLISGCAGESTMSITAKGLLTGRQVLIGAARVGDSLCTANVIKQADCDTMKVQYKEGQAKYQIGSDAMMNWVVLGADTGNTAQDALSAINAICAGIQKIVGPYQPTGGK